MELNFLSLRAAVSKIPDDVLKLPYLGMNLGPLTKVPEVGDIHIIYLMGSKLSLFSPYRQRDKG